MGRRKSEFPRKVSWEYEVICPRLARTPGSEEMIRGGGLFGRIISTVVGYAERRPRAQPQDQVSPTVGSQAIVLL